MVLRATSCLPLRLAYETCSQTSRSQSLRRLEHQPAASRTFSITPIASARRKEKQRHVFRDAYTIKQQEARKAAQIARSEKAKARRAEEIGDPLRGKLEPTAFVKSFDGSTESGPASSHGSSETTTDASISELAAALDTSAETLTQLGNDISLYSNHYLTVPELQSSLTASEHLSAPYKNPNRSAADPAREQREEAEHAAAHATRMEAISRILAAGNANSRERTKINIRRCIETFGRHRTDQVFPPPPRASPTTQLEGEVVVQRAGPDTGSSEVQIAILTAKIRVLAREYEGRSKNDKINKRNLRVLMHRRQKLLKYFERKSRGGERWRHLIETLGLTEATWRGEIELR